MKTSILPSGTVTSPKGFSAGATHAGIKNGSSQLDLGILASKVPCTAAAVFTTNRIQAAPVVLSRQHLQSGRASAVVVNSGCANAGTGKQGLKDAAEMAALTAAKLGVPAESVVVASTGVIGPCLAMPKIRAGITKITLTRDGGHKLEKAMMTTDRVPKEIAVSMGTYTIGGAAKGSGMIHPNLATMLCFLTTDAAVELEFLRQALRNAADLSFNMVSVDGDTSTNDTLLLMANGMAGNEPISAGTPDANDFQQALNEVCIHLAKSVARDGEGATKLIEVTVTGAPDVAQARQVARTIVNSSLVKTAVYGNDPNWGRILAAAGRSGVDVVEQKISLNIGGVDVLKNGRQLSFTREEVAGKFKQNEVKIALELGLGRASATAWGCDMTEEYVKINAEYTT